VVLTPRTGMGRATHAVHGRTLDGRLYFYNPLPWPWFVVGRGAVGFLTFDDMNLPHDVRLAPALKRRGHVHPRWGVSVARTRVIARHSSVVPL